jgi:hypothetical protein
MPLLLNQKVAYLNGSAHCYGLIGIHGFTWLFAEYVLYSLLNLNKNYI